MAKNSKWKIKEAVKIAEKAGMLALQIGAKGILAESKGEVPVLTGTLKRSGTVTIGGLPSSDSVYQASLPNEEGGSGIDHSNAFPNPIGKEKAVFISYSAPYAIIQHEELGYSHSSGGKAKFLEDPFNRNKKKVVKMVEEAIKKSPPRC